MKKVFLLLFIMSIHTLNAKVIATVPEASGICYIPKTKSLFVANDEGWIYELSQKGKIIRKKYLGKYDLEGLVYNVKTDELYLVDESRNGIIVLKRKSLKLKRKIKIKKKYKGKKILTKSTKSGLEAIAINDEKLYLSHQASVVFKIETRKKKDAKIVQIFQHGYKDIAGLTFHNNKLYMVSDKENLLIQYSLEKNKTLQKIKLPKFAQEGLCFDDENNIYFADDNGRVLKYKTKKLGLK